MRRSTHTACLAALVGACGSMAQADVALLTQQRTLSVTTTSDGNTQSASASDFSPFVQTLSVGTTFPGPAGSVANLASGRIDCQVDPNTIRASGTLTGAGGILAATGATQLGDAKCSVIVTFEVNSAAPFSLVAAPRPSLHPTDEFEVTFRDQTRNVNLISLGGTDPARAVDIRGVLQPGTYLVKYKVEATFDGDQTSRDYSFNLSMPTLTGLVDCNGNGVDDRIDIALGNAPDANHDWVIDSCQCRADWTGDGGVSVQDLFAFLDDWFAGRADFDHSGSTSVQDLFSFLGAWFSGCS